MPKAGLEHLDTTTTSAEHLRNLSSLSSPNASVFSFEWGDVSSRNEPQRKTNMPETDTRQKSPSHFHSTLPGGLSAWEEILRSPPRNSSSNQVRSRNKTPPSSASSDNQAPRFIANQTVPHSVFSVDTGPSQGTGLALYDGLSSVASPDRANATRTTAWEVPISEAATFWDNFSTFTYVTYMSHSLALSCLLTCVQSNL
jgi:hypothetical protein